MSFATRYQAEFKKARLARAKNVKKEEDKLSYKLNKFSKNLDLMSGNLMRRVTIPIILFIIGGVTFPIGILFWLLALYMATSKKQ